MNAQSQVPDLESILQVIVLEVPNKAVMASPAFNIKRVVINPEPCCPRLPDPSPVSLREAENELQWLSQTSAEDVSIQLT